MVLQLSIPAPQNRSTERGGEQQDQYPYGRGPDIGVTPTVKHIGASDQPDQRLDIHRHLCDAEYQHAEEPPPDSLDR
jgi:hypothetical protein